MFHPFLLIALIYYVIKKILRYSRRYYRTYVRAYQYLDDLVRRRGGHLRETGHRALLYQPSAGEAHLEIDCSSYPRLMIRVPHEFPFSVALHRMPRLFYAFAEAFISPPLRIDGLPYFSVGSSSAAVGELKSKQGIMNLLSELSVLGFSARFTASELVLKKRLYTRDLQDESLFRAISIAQDLTQLCGKAAIQIPMHTLESDNRCAYCREMIHPDDSVIHCSVCKTPHHSECFALNHKCAVFGCNSSRPVETPVPVLN
jgi:Prokaryotic RING finger family 1